MKRLHLGLILLITRFAAAAPPVADVVPVTEDFFGTKVTDPYRYFENMDEARVQSWFKGQADFSRGILDGLSGRAVIAAEIEKYVNGSPAAVSGIKRLPGEIYFFLRTAAGQDVAQLYMRKGLAGQDVLLVDTNRLAGPHGEPAAINYYEPSWDGRFVAYGVSVGGSEDAVMHVVDVEAGKELPEVIDRAQYGGVNWRLDNHSFFYTRLKKMAPGESDLHKFDKPTAYLHILGTSPESDAAVLGFGLSPRVELTPLEDAWVAEEPGSDWAIGGIGHGVKNEMTLYVAPAASVTGPATPWTKVLDVDANVTYAQIHGDDLYLLSHDDAPRYKLIRTSMSHPDLEHAATIVPEQHGVLRGVTAAADGLYLQELDGAVDNILRVPFEGGEVKRLKMPFEGGHDVESSNARLPGVVLRLASWTKGSRVAIYDPATDQVTPTNLQPAGKFDDLDEITSMEVRVPSYDGVEVPLSIICKKGIPLDGTNPTAVFAYGGYGITYDSGLNPANLAWIERGGIYAIAHVRGGGEFGEPWHLGAQKLTKPNVWRDLIACCEYLIAKKYTSPSHLALYGGSNGGITVGRAITERPDLFAAAFIRAGCMNPLRAEFSPNGPPNVPEFGSVATQEGFEDLFAMDAYQRVRDGVRYPAVLQYTGINDPRVAPWEPAKMTARLQAATGSGKPVMLTVDYQGGHGIGMSKKQRIDTTADMFSFFLWQMNDPAFLEHASFHPDIEYENVNDESIKLDAAVPDGDGPFPIAILVHGGGWSSGDKEREFPELFQSLSAAKFTWFSIDYRLAPKHQWPACFEDMQAAIRWVKAHAAEYKGDPKRIALIGYSAGGELVTLAAVRADAETSVAAVVGFSPPTDMAADTVRRNGISTNAKNLLGVTTLDDHAKELIHEMSPIDFVHPGLPPFLFIQGDADKSVMYAFTQHFAEKLKANGVEEEFITVPGGPHDVFQWEGLLPDYRERVVGWLQRTLRK